MNNELLYQVALTLIPAIGPVQAKALLQHLSPEEIFRTRRSLLEKIEGIGSIRANSIKQFRDFSIAEKEIAFMDKYGISSLFITDALYPQRLLNCYDSPILLFYKGRANLNTSRIIAVVGTRNNTDYGKQLTENLIEGLAGLQVTIVSGLAYGIDGIAHKAALKSGLPTIGVLAHGLDQVYPARHFALAAEMAAESGGLLTEFRSGSKPDRHNFPARNRVVAGMSDATIVIETGLKGGSMITAELANGYNKDVFAFPGKTTDPKSSGCNYLVKTNKALLLTGAEDIIDLMNWSAKEKSAAKKQKELFIELSAGEKIIFELLKERETADIDEINLLAGLSSSAVAAALLNLELNNIIFCRPGKRYSLL